MPSKDWLWVLTVLTVAVGFYFGLSATSEWLGASSVFSAPPLAPAELRPGASEKYHPQHLLWNASSQAMVGGSGLFLRLGLQYPWRGILLPGLAAAQAGAGIR